MRMILGAILAMAVATPVLAQDNTAEIVVTARRVDADDAESQKIPVIGLKRRGDFLVQRYYIISDTRDFERRRDEVYETLKNIVAAADSNSDIALSVGENELRAVTSANYRAIPLDSNFRNRADTSYVSLYVKHRLASDGSNAKSAVTAIESFTKKIKLAGRSEVLPDGDTQISILNPQQYRYPILQLIADDAKKVSGMLGTDYGIYLSSFTRPVEWIGETPTEVFMFIRYDASISPKSK